MAQAPSPPLSFPFSIASSRRERRCPREASTRLPLPSQSTLLKGEVLPTRSSGSAADGQSMPTSDVVLQRSLQLPQGDFLERILSAVTVAVPRRRLVEQVGNRPSFSAVEVLLICLFGMVGLILLTLCITCSGVCAKENRKEQWRTDIKEKTGPTDVPVKKTEGRDSIASKHSRNKESGARELRDLTFDRERFGSGVLMVTDLEEGDYSLPPLREEGSASSGSFTLGPPCGNPAGLQDEPDVVLPGSLASKESTLMEASSGFRSGPRVHWPSENDSEVAEEIRGSKRSPTKDVRAPRSLASSGEAWAARSGEAWATRNSSLRSLQQSEAIESLQDECQDMWSSSSTEMRSFDYVEDWQDEGQGLWAQRSSSTERRRWRESGSGFRTQGADMKGSRRLRSLSPVKDSRHFPATSRDGVKEADFVEGPWVCETISETLSETSTTLV
uniref:Transmembrane protein n=1 Tax=Alexandrium monilatum TaxID=311494 RepID=A0A7S4RFN7_9DINO